MFLFADGKWERAKLVGAEINHKTFAILGFGTIGRLAAKRAVGLGMRVIAYDPFVTPEIFAECGAESVDLDTLGERSRLFNTALPND